jgi:hypothetical protein
LLAHGRGQAIAAHQPLEDRRQGLAEHRVSPLLKELEAVLLVQDHDGRSFHHAQHIAPESLCVDRDGHGHLPLFLQVVKARPDRRLRLCPNGQGGDFLSQLARQAG